VTSLLQNSPIKKTIFCKSTPIDSELHRKQNLWGDVSFAKEPYEKKAIFCKSTPIDSELHRKQNIWGDVSFAKEPCEKDYILQKYAYRLGASQKTKHMG